VQAVAGGGEPVLWITDRGDAAVPDRGDVLRITTFSGNPRTLDPKRVHELRAAVAAFLDERGSGTVVLDCADLLALHNGVERVVRALDDLHEEVATRAAVLAVFLDPRGSNPRLLAWLEREFDAMPRAALETDAEARLLV